MPLPMVHLSVAIHYLEKYRIDPQGTFFLGNIAPDSIHMRPGISKEDKPKTHFFPDEKEDYLLKLERLYSPILREKDEKDWKWFVRGYFMHLITDYFWFRELYPSFVEKNSLSGLTKDEIRTLYYRETDQIDFNIYHLKAWRAIVWDKLNEVRAYDFVDLLTSKEILMWRDRTFSFFNDPLKEPKIIPINFTDDKVSTFIENAASRIGAILNEWE